MLKTNLYFDKADSWERVVLNVSLKKYLLCMHYLLGMYACVKIKTGKIHAYVVFLYEILG